MLCLAASANLALAQTAHLEITGYNRLKNEVGGVASVSDLIAGQVEAVITTEANDFAPDATNPQFAGKTFTLNPTDGTPSGHATGVGVRYYGLVSSFSPEIGSIHSWSANTWLGSGGLRSGTGDLPISDSSSALNHSWIGSFGTNPADITAAEDVYRRLDYVVQQNQTFVAAGMNNGYSTILPQLLGQGYNLVTVGRSDGQHSAGFTTLAGNGRIKPDIVAPAGTTSDATPIIASAGLFLRATAEADANLALAADPRALKALLLATASKYKFPEWTQTSTRPLDLRYGAGELNVYNAHRTLTSGQRAFSASTTHPARGWDLNTTTNNSPGRTYFFEIPTNNTASRFSATLAWHRQITYNSFLGTYSAINRNLTLRLHSASNFNVGAQIAESASPVDNVEHLYLPNLAPGRYILIVTTPTNNIPYSLAWFTAPTVALVTNAPANVLRSDSTPLTFTFTRAGGDLSLPLTVPLSLSGNAVSGIHYTPAIPASLTFAPNVTTAEFTINPVPAADPDAPSTTLSTTLAADFASAPDPSANTHKLAFHARPYSAWRFARFSTAQLADPLVSGDTADPDGDGIVNLLEYAFGLEPLSADSPATAAERLPAVTLDAQNHLNLSYFHAADRPDLAYLAEWSADLVAPWQSGATFTEEISREPLAGGERVTVRALSPVDSNTSPRHFLRLSVTRQ